LRFQTLCSFGGQLTVGRSLLLKACPQRGVFLLGGQLFESDGLLQVFGQHFHLHAVHDPSGWIALSLVFTGQMSSRIFDQPLMIAHTFLAHFDDPFCKPLASCHGLSVARK
jgi:hypothetical protein